MTFPPKSKKPRRPTKKEWKALDSEQWWEITISFPAKAKHAQWFYDQLDEQFLSTICQGTDGDKRHRCRRPFVAGMKPIDLDDE